MDSQRALLDELMGADRNLVTNEKNKNRRNFYDDNVCKFYICGFCPHDLFTNTKSDLGPCPKVHDDIFRREWETYPSKHRYPYEGDFVRFLERQINELDRRIEKHHKRLEIQEGTQVNGSVPEDVQLRMASIDAECEVLLRKIETLGEEGLVDEANACHDKLKSLKVEKDLLTKSQASTIGIAGTPEKRMRVCEVCGAYLVISDTEKRTASHLDGKQHKGYALIRETLDDYFRKQEDNRLRSAFAEEMKEQEVREVRETREPRPETRKLEERREDRRGDERREDRRGERRDDRRGEFRRDDFRRGGGGRRSDHRDHDRRDRGDYSDRDYHSRKRERSRSRSREREDKRRR